MASDAVEILLVEDNAEDIELTLRGLKKHNLANRVFTVRDGEEALEFIFGSGRYSGRNINNTPKLILLDLKLPKVNGLEVLQQVKSNEKTRFIPVVVLTSSAEEKDIIESYRLGVNSYITKPVDFDKFLQSISEIGLYWLLINRPPVMPV